jgi:hypothetical protein
VRDCCAAAVVAVEVDIALLLKVEMMLEGVVIDRNARRGAIDMRRLDGKEVRWLAFFRSL